MSEAIYTEKMSVRKFVEFLCRSGNLDRRGVLTDASAMREGVKLHIQIQSSQPDTYTSEVVLRKEADAEYEGEVFGVVLEGRADGIIRINNPIEKFEYDDAQLINFESTVFVDEIKCMYARVQDFDEPLAVHLAQAKCYALTILEEENLEKIGVQITYVNIETEKIKYFVYEYGRDELTEWFYGLVKEYAKWMHFSVHHTADRNASIKETDFPFPYRPGQAELVRNVYLTLLRKKKIFIEAPTGVGKTISTVYPAVKALGEGLVNRLFYVTAKTITRTVAEEAAAILASAGADLLVVTLTAKEKICAIGKPSCNPRDCVRAKGHEDRVNDAVYDIITHERMITRDVIDRYAEKHMVCPFEFSLDVASWCDMVICDYNYCFDPDAHLKRFFTEPANADNAILVDEAHNLVHRAREMYSAALSGDRIKQIRPFFKERDDIKKYFTRTTSALNSLMRDAHDGLNRIGFEECEKFISCAERLYEKLYGYVTDRKVNPDEEVLEFFFELRNFVDTVTYVDEDYVMTLSVYGKSGVVAANCMNPHKRLGEYLRFFRGAAFFSATLLPVRYYMGQFGGNEEDYAVYAPSPFDNKKRKILVAADVSAKYTRRTRTEFEKMADYIDIFIHSKTGNHMVFFPSYKMMDDVFAVFRERYGNGMEDADFTLLIQTAGMTEGEREAFLASFDSAPEKSLVGFCVMGGIFSEGIDLRSDRLIGVVIVGTGLPMVSDENELLKNYYDGIEGVGFENAYLYPGINKVLQAGGRVIRAEEDVGAVLLLDERFLMNQYKSLFPREWENAEVVRISDVADKLSAFWEEHP